MPQQISNRIPFILSVNFLLLYVISWRYNGQYIPLLTLSSILLVGSLLYTSYGMFRSGLVWTKAFLPNFMLAWIVWYGLTLLWSTVPYSSWFYFWELGSLPLTFLAWFTIPKDYQDKAWRYVWVGIMATTWVLIAIALYQYFVLFNNRPTGPLYDINSYAAWMNLIMFPTLAVYMNRESARQTPFLSRRIDPVSMFYLATLTLIFFAFFSTASRGGTLSWVCTIPWALWLFGKRPNTGRNWLMLGCVFIVAFLFMEYVHHYDMFMELMPHYISHNIATVSRWDMWVATWHMYLAHPLLGTGLGSYFLYYPIYRLPAELGSAGTYDHNDFLQFLAEGGPLNLGFLLTFTAGIFYNIYRVYKIRKADFVNHSQSNVLAALGLTLGVYAITGHALGNFIFYNYPLSILAGLFMARAWQLLYPHSETMLTKPLLYTLVPPNKTVRVWLLGFVFAVFSLLCLVLDAVTYAILNNSNMMSPYVEWSVPEKLHWAAFMSAVRPISPEPHLYLGYVYSRLGGDTELNMAARKKAYLMAIQQYKEAISGIPENPSIYNRMALIYFMDGPVLGLTAKQRVDMAVPLFAKALYMDPANTGVRYKLALLKYGLYRETNKEVDFMLQAEKTALFPMVKASMYYYIAHIQYNGGEVKQARKTIVHVLQKYPGYMPAYSFARTKLRVTD